MFSINWFIYIYTKFILYNNKNLNYNIILPFFDIFFLHKIILYKFFVILHIIICLVLFIIIYYYIKLDIEKLSTSLSFHIYIYCISSVTRILRFSDMSECVKSDT